MRGLTLFGPIIIGLSQVIPLSAPLWKEFSSDREILVNLLSLYFVIMSATIILEIKDRNDEIKSSLLKFAEASKNQFTGKRIPDHEFYHDFMNEIRKATSSVNISYFSPYPPDTTTHSDRKEYYRKIKTLVKRSPRVRFRRLVRYTDLNLPWIKEMLNDYNGVPNFDLAVIRDLEKSDVKMSYSLSVQVVDSSKCWLVAIESHENQSQFRDLYLESKEIGDSLNGYYSRLWNMSDKLIESGVLTDKGKGIQIL